MPAKSKAQDRLMRAVAHNQQFAKKVGVPQSVGKDFVAHTTPALRKKLPDKK